jgi:Tol biopolymer transport system component
MGEVYRARDTRLDRTVAVKVLPAHLATDPSLRQRLEREAKALSSLSHPNICGLFDIGQQDGVDFLVMEHLEGETLAQRLSRGPLPADELLRCSLQIADALDKAHRRGVVHRDLKPANIMLGKGGAKLLDFGLAKANAGAVAVSEVSSSPTESRRPLTTEGTLLGTFQYMAPEQLEGKEADVRTDIFALGAVLYEMATGKRAFSGTSQASLIASIMHEQPPPISTLQPLTPPAFDRVVRACLAKDPDDRWQTAHDVVLELQWIQEGGSQAGLPAPVSARRHNREKLAWAAFSLALVVAAGFAAGFVQRAPRARPIGRFQIAAPEGFSFIGSPSLSPNGRMIAFDGRDAVGEVRIWIRQMDVLAPRALSGTEGASRPFWSPDSRFVAFVAGGKLKKVDVSGGPPQSLADTPGGSDGSWSREGVLLLDGRGSDPILRIPAAGGAPKPEVKSNPSADVVGVGWPQFLPDGRHFLYVVVARNGTSKLMLRALDSEDSKLLIETPSRVQFVEPGYLLYVKEDTLVAQRFDAKRLRIEGEAVPLSEGLGIDAVGLAHFTASDDGTLVYRAGETRNRQLLWVERSGKERDAVGDPAEWGDVWPAPDGRRLVVDLSERSTRPDLWIRDLARGTNTRFTFDPASEIAPVWSPDGRRIVFSSNRNGVFNLYEKDAAGTGEERELLASETLDIAADWSRDGRLLLFYRQGKDTGWDIWALSMQGEKKAFPVVQTKFAELRPSLSPDGRYMAYQSDESGRAEIYVVNFPTPSSKWQVSTSGGRQPFWSANGREIFYLSLDNALMAVDVEVASTFTAGTPQRLFPARLQPGTLRAQYRPSPDGQRFLTLAPLGRDSIMPMTVVLNWTEELKH